MTDGCAKLSELVDSDITDAVVSYCDVIERFSFMSLPPPPPLPPPHGAVQSAARCPASVPGHRRELLPSRSHGPLRLPRVTPLKTRFARVLVSTLVLAPAHARK